MSDDELGERLRSERERIGLNQKDFGAAAGVHKNSQAAYEAGRTPPTTAYLQAIEALGADAGFVLTGRRYSDRPSPVDVAQGRLAPRHLAVGPVMLPEIDIGYAMGDGIVIADHVDGNMVPFPRDWLRPLIRGTFEDVFIARGEGDSMQPTLLDGDIVIIDTAHNALTAQDRIWCVSYGELGMIKRLRAMPDKGIQVMSDNPAVAPFTAYDGELHIIGRVIWIGRRA